MKNTTLLIMAAGIGSRFGGGIKQLEPVGLHDEIIMDYSIHDAIEAGFNKEYVSLTAVMGVKHILYLQILAYVFIQKIMINIGMLISGSIFNWDC